MATVLIVEDEFSVSEVLGSFLADEGHHVLTAADGRQGLERLAEGPRPDLVIADHMMPVLDGAGMLQAMRAAEAHRDIPCIVMSAASEANLRGRSGGCAAFLRKPFRIAAVVQLVATVLGAARPSRPSDREAVQNDHFLQNTQSVKSWAAASHLPVFRKGRAFDAGCLGRCADCWPADQGDLGLMSICDGWELTTDHVVPFRAAQEIG